MRRTAGKGQEPAATAVRALEGGPVHMAKADSKALLYQEASSKHLMQAGGRRRATRASSAARNGTGSASSHAHQLWRRLFAYAP